MSDTLTFEQQVQALTNETPETVRLLAEASRQHDAGDDAILTLLKCGVPTEAILATHLSTSLDICRLGYDLIDAAEIVGHASAAFGLVEGGSIRLLPSLVRNVAGKPRRIR